MDYEKLYKEALERARKLHSETEYVCEMKMLEQIFHELKESEDEKIRKSIIELIKYNGGCLQLLDKPFNGVPIDTMLDWLEKQGAQREQLINKASDLLVNCIEDYMSRRMEVWKEECKKQTLENIRKKLEE